MEEFALPLKNNQHVFNSLKITKQSINVGVRQLTLSFYFDVTSYLYFCSNGVKTIKSPGN